LATKGDGYLRARVNLPGENANFEAGGNIMEIKKVYAVYFSPTGTTEKAVVTLASGTALPVEKIDLTTPGARKTNRRIFGSDELVVVGLPVYGGRLPKNLEDFFSGLQGQATPAVVLVMYGNREYDDALIELKVRLEERGFGVIAGTAFVGEHTFSRNIAAGRPNENDLTVAAGFGKQIMESLSRDSAGVLTIKGNYPSALKGYDPSTPGPHPTYPNIVTSESCIECGVCAENCPWGAIHKDDFTIIDSPKCLRCFRCIKICPAAAKQVTDENFLAFLPQFEMRLNARRREPELFLRQP
jgi:ferredoxin/flavodoxin